MKEVKLEITNTTDLIRSSEVNTVYDINISPFDATTEYIEFDEQIDEKLVSYIEKEIRSSYEYRQYIKYLKDELDLTKCSLLPGIDCSDGAAELEFHHYPLNLFEITEAVAHKMVKTLAENEKTSCFDIAERVMEEHYKGDIGLVPLTKTMHKMAHNRSIIIPITKVEGNYKKFIQKYSSYIPEDIKIRIKDTEIESISDDAKLFNDAKLTKNITMFNISYNNQEEEDNV